MLSNSGLNYGTPVSAKTNENIDAVLKELVSLVL